MNHKTVGVVLDSDFEYGVSVYEGIRLAAEKLPGLSIAPVTQSQQGLMMRMLETGKLDGVIMPVISDRWVQSLSPSLPPVVNISGMSRIESVCSVVTDDFYVGKLAATHLVQLGMRRACVISERSIYSSSRRRSGFCACMDEAGFNVEQPDYRGAYSYEGAWESWLFSLKGEMDLYGTSDRVTRRFLKLYNRLKDSLQVRIGAIVGTGDSLAERTLAGIELSSVVLPAGRIGVEAVKVMQGIFMGDNRVVCREIKPDQLKVRVSSEGSSVIDSVIGRAQGYIERRIAEHFTVDDVAHFAGASRRSLEMHFTHILGVAPAEYVREKRLKLAERLLLETTLTVREVAVRCSAGSLQAFTTLFKKRYGIPPAKFRRGRY